MEIYEPWFVSDFHNFKDLKKLYRNYNAVVRLGK